MCVRAKAVMRPGRIWRTGPHMAHPGARGGARAPQPMSLVKRKYTLKHKHTPAPAARRAFQDVTNVPQPAARAPGALDPLDQLSPIPRVACDDIPWLVDEALVRDAEALRALEGAADRAAEGRQRRAASVRRSKSKIYPCGPRAIWLRQRSAGNLNAPSSCGKPDADFFDRLRRKAQRSCRSGRWCPARGCRCPDSRR